ncbi:helix-turn-helix transcriptional regulator [Mycobacterium sp.]|uniref:helix-turn-helix transcriptional regulator n=1 Tax=Mycobacterium sp. TaxID=1785 RepID=UPI003D13D585
MTDTGSGLGTRASWYRRTYSNAIAEARLSPGGELQLMRMRQPAGQFLGPATTDLTINLLLRDFAGARADFGAGRFNCHGRRGDFALTPAGVPCSYDIDSPHEFLILTLPHAIAQGPLDDAGKERLPDHGPLHAALQRDNQIECLMRRLWSESEGDNPMGTLLADDIAVALAGRLARLVLRASNESTAMSGHAAPLPGIRLAQVISRIEDELGANIRQIDLADTAGLSPWHFCRAFKAASGVAPHRFVLLRRLARAQGLLRTTKMDIVEVALACGFSSHAHFTSTFRREVGVAPSTWRSNNMSR